MNTRPATRSSQPFTVLSFASGIRLLCATLPPLLLGCSSSDGTAFSSAGKLGAERASCRADGTCDPGLVCLSDLCVKMSDAGVSGSGGSSSASGGASGASASGGAEAIGGRNGGGASNGGNGASATGGVAAGSGGRTASGGGTASGGAVASGGAGGVTCRGQHPNVEGQRRFCDAGSCYCTDPFDTCFTADVATTCCQNTPICGDTPSARGVDCGGMHPIVGPPRTCDPGNCFCSNGTTVDVCYPAAMSDACCPPSIQPVCVPGN